MHPGDRRERHVVVYSEASGDWYQPLMPPSSCDSEIFQVSDFPHSFARFRSGVGLISVKLLISPISRHAAKRLDLTGQAWASTETTDLQAKLWIGNVPKPGAACCMESSSLHDDTRSTSARNSTFPIGRHTFYTALKSNLYCPPKRRGYRWKFYGSK